MNMFLNVIIIMLLVLSIIETIKTKYHKVHIKAGVITMLVLCFIHTILKTVVGICLKITGMAQLIVNNVRKIDAYQHFIFIILILVVEIFVVVYIRYKKRNTIKAEKE